MKIKRILVVSFYVFLLIVGWFLSNHKINLILAPDTIFTTITGKKIALKKLRGKPVLITFWATDCKSCIEEVPHLIKLYNDYHSRGLEIIAIAMYYDPPNHVVNMTKAKQIPYDVTLDLRGKHAKNFGNIQLTPSTLLVNLEGLISFRKTGGVDIVAMEKRIQQMLDLK